MNLSKVILTQCIHITDETFGTQRTEQNGHKISL